MMTGGVPNVNRFKNTAETCYPPHGKENVLIFFSPCGEETTRPIFSPAWGKNSREVGVLLVYSSVDEAAESAWLCSKSCAYRLFHAGPPQNGKIHASIHHEKRITQKQSRYNRRTGCSNPLYSVATCRPFLSHTRKSPAGQLLPGASKLGTRRSGRLLRLGNRDCCGRSSGWRRNEFL